MGKYFKKWKSSAKFRKQVIIAVILLYILSGYYGDTGTQATYNPNSDCDKYNNDVLQYFGIEDEQALKDCGIAGCEIQVWNVPDTWWTFGTNSALKCVNCVQTGSYTRDKDACCSGSSTELTLGNKILYCGDYFGQCYECKPKGEGEFTACKSWEKPFAKILDSIWKKSGIEDCSTKAYMVLAFGGILVLAVV